MSVMCHDGESVQGSHVAQWAAIYILQWKYSSNVGNQFSHDGNSGDSTKSSSHKAQIMYFYEVLPSANYKYVNKYDKV